MRHGRTFRKRLLTFLLSLAMVLTSVNVPMLTVWAEEETPIENEDTVTPPVEDGDHNSADGNEEGDVAGEGTTPADPPQDATTPDDGQNPVGGGINPPSTSDDPDAPQDPAEGDADDPDDDVTMPDDSEDDATTPDDPDDTNKPSDPEVDEPNPVDPKGEEEGKAVDNEFEATGTHGATYDEATKEVTFFVNGGEEGDPDRDQFYSQINHMWYMEYDSYATAAKNHVSKGGNFLGDSSHKTVNFTEDTETNKKTVTVSVTEGTGAILYYINGEAGHDRTKYEHIIVIDPNAEPGEIIPEAPKTPVGLDAKWWDEPASANHGKIFISWASVSADEVTGWELSIDDEIVVENLENKAGTPPYFASNVYAAGEHKVSLVAINSVGRSEAATVTFKLTQEQAGLKEPKKKNNIIISEQLAQAKAGEKITLSWVADNEEFIFEDYTVAINGTAVDDLTKITVGNDSIEMGASLFPSAGTYRIQFEKEGFNFSPVYQVVYAADTTDNWTMTWNDEFSGTALDTSKWDYQTGNGSAYGVSGWGNSEAQIYTKNNTTVADGKLTITAKKEADGSYTSARLRTVKEEITDGKATVGTPLQIGTYGKVESKIKMPAGNGIWPAFWMLPHDSEYGTWAASGEIDIMEARGRLPGEVCGTIHYGNVWPNNSSSGETYQFKDGDSIEQYHVYTIEWDPTEMRWYVDGELYSTLTNWYSVQSESGNYPYPAPFDEKFYVLLNLALGGTFDSGTTEIAVDEVGVDMDVDYVRWYQREGGYDDWDLKQPETPKDDSETAAELLALKDENGNYIKDGDFSQMNTEPYTKDGAWKVERGYWAPLLIPGNGNGSATWSKEKVEDKNYLKVAVKNVGSQTYSSQMLQYFPVVKGYSYEISYTAYTDAANQKADIALQIGGDADNGWSKYSGSYADKLTTTPTTYTHKFTMTAATDPTARFEFNLATSAGNVYLSDVCVKVIDGISEDEDEDNDKEPLADGNHVYNGGFSNGTDSLLYWHWGTSDETDKVSVKKDGKERKAQITASESDPVSLWQYGMNLLQKDDYVLTFDVDSDAAQEIGLKVSDKDGTVEYAAGTKSVEAGASKVEWTFTQPEGKTDTSGKLVLTFKGNSKIDNVKLIRTTYNNVDYDKVELYPLANGDFSNGLTGWNIWHEGAGWETHKVNDQGQLELNDVTVGANATFYCIGIKSPSMTLTKGVNYKVQFDYTLPEAKTYTLQLGGDATQREITLEGGTHTYVSDEIPGSGSGEFALFLGPNKSESYTLLLDNIVVSAVLPEKDGYKRPVSLAQTGKTKLGSDVVVTYTGDTAERENEWGSAEKKYYLKGVEADASKVSVDTTKKTITLDASLFTAEGEYAFYVKAEGFVETKAINLAILDASGNLLINGGFSDGKNGWGSHFADGGACGSFTVNDDGVAVIHHQYDTGNSWDIQLSQNVEYPAGDYIVTFDAWADVERPLHVQMLPMAGTGALSGASNYVNISDTKKNYKVIWKGMAAGTNTTVLNFEMGSMTYDGVTSPNDGNKPYDIYMDNIVFRPLTEDDEAASPATITSAGAGKAGTDNVTVTCANANEEWQNASKTVYVNDTAVSAAKVVDHKTSLVIDKSVFTAAGRYSIYVVAEGFEETNKIFKNIIGADGNLIFGGDMNDASQWVVYDEDAENLSKGSIANGVYTLDYKAGYFRDDWNCWITWSSQLKKENISVNAGTRYVLSFEASTDLADGRTIEIEYGKAGVEGNPKKTVVVKQGETGVYEIEIDIENAMDDFYICYLLGPVGENLQVKDNAVVPHTLTIDNVAFKPISSETPEHHEGLWIKEIEPQTYTGAAIKPEIEVRFNDELLQLKKDYTVAYKNNTNAGEATVTVTGKGNFKGKDTAVFTIHKKNINAADITAADVYAILKANGTVVNPKVTVKFGRKTLKNNNDYKVIYPDFEKDADGKIAANDYQIIISTTAVKKKNGVDVDSANYTGSRIINYTVRENGTLLMSSARITLDKTKVDYAGDSTGKPQVTGVKIGSTMLTQDVDYTVTYDENWNRIGKAAVIVTAKEGTKYYGSKTVSYTVNGTKLAAKELQIEGIEADGYDYTGEPVFISEEAADPAMRTLKVTRIKAGGRPIEGGTILVEGTDYTVSYKTGRKAGEHTNAGTVTVTITGINAYTGSVSRTFKIKPADLAALGTNDAPAGFAFAAEETAKYNKTGAKPVITRLTYNGRPLVEKQDYTVTYQKNNTVTAGDTSAVMTIKGKGNFKGSYKHSYKVTAASAEDVYAAAADIVKPVKFNQVKTAVKVFETETGKVLKAGTDYEKTITYYSDPACTEASEITAENFAAAADIDQVIYAKVTMRGNYAGTGETPGVVTAAFRVYDKDLKMTSKKLEIRVDTTTDREGNPIACDGSRAKNPYYTGADIEPKVTVTLKGSGGAADQVLTEGTDYAVAYSNNRNKGKATVTVTGTGNGCGGTKNLKFTIVSKDMKWYEEVSEKIASFFSNLF